MPAPVPAEEGDSKTTGGAGNDDYSWPPPPEINRTSKIMRKIKENPFVPLGCLATVGALTFGLVQLIRGNSVRSQQAMRMRVLAQGGTIVALVIGVFISSSRTKP